MASGKSSSKKKSSSSSSHKKELSKKSSSEVRRKRSRSRKRDKLKKIRRRDLSVSCSDDDSRTEDSLSMSSSDSDGGYSRRKGRSHSRGDVKDSKKRRRRSLSIGNDRIHKKRKRSKLRDSFKEKKKSHHRKSHKKHTRKDAIVDSASDDLRSLSIHRGTNSESDVESSKGRTKRREKSIDKTIIAEDRYNYRSRSCSPCSGGNQQSRYRNVDKLVTENHSNHLRSVLTIPDEGGEVDAGRYRGKDENEAEIIQAYDDYPSSKSNESYDGGRKKEYSHQAFALHEEMVEGKRRKESSYQLNSLTEKNGKIERSQSAKSHKEDSVGQPSKIDQTAHLVSTQTENKSSSVLVTSDVGDLESILRQKALENFKKFRGSQQAKTSSRDQKGLNDRDVKCQYTSKDKPITTESSKEAGREVVGGKNIQASVLHDQKGEDNIDVKHSCPSSDKTVKNESSKEADSGVVGEVIEASKLENVSTATEIIPTTCSPKPNFQTFESNEPIKNESRKEVSKLKNVSTATMERVPVTPSSLPKHNVQISDGNSSRLQSDGILHADDRVFDEKATGKKIINLGAIRKSNQGSLVYRREPSGNTSIKQASDMDRSHGKLPETKHIQNQIAEPNKAVIGSNVHHEINEVPKSTSEVTATLTPATGDHSSTGTGAKGGSEFEQKTMSVMRGGEIVQVSYKVYIPKKPPALARRQLNR